MATISKNCIVIAFTGTLGSGKDFLADITRKHLFEGRIVQNVSFADLLKMNSMLSFEEPYGEDAERNLGSSECGLDTVEERYTEFFSTKPENVRKAIQNYGENLRLRNPNIWIHGLYTQMLNQYHVNGVTVFLISDLRFPMEADFVREIGGTIIRVWAPVRSAGVQARYSDKAVNTHISETFVDKITADHIINNDATEYNDLVSQLDVIVQGAMTRCRHPGQGNGLPTG